MELNEKIAARRRELEVEAQRAEAAQRRELATQRKVQDEKQAVDKVERAAKQRALNDAAMDRWSGAEFGVFLLLCFLVLFGLVLGVWPGLVMLAVVWMYVRNKMDKYRAEVAAESETHASDKMP